MRNIKSPTTRQIHHQGTVCSKSSSTDGGNVTCQLPLNIQPYTCPEVICGRRFWSVDKTLDHAWEDHSAARNSSSWLDYIRMSHSSCPSRRSSPLSRAPSLASSVSTLKSDQLSTGISVQRNSQLLQPKSFQASSFLSRFPSQLSISNTSDQRWGAIDSLRLLPERRCEQDTEQSYCDSSISSDSLDSTGSIPIFSEASSSSFSSPDDTLPFDPETERSNLEANLVYDPK